jgi:chorismate synthase
VTIDGCPAGISIKEKDFEADLQRRKTGDLGSSSRLEPDLPRLISGVYKGFSTGSPITILFENTSIQSQDYSQFQDHPRPGHADYAAKCKYGGFNDHRGGGHLSARLTLGLTSAGVIAKKIIDPMQVKAELVAAGGESDITKAIQAAQAAQDSIGGLITCSVTAVPSGLGEPLFDSVESLISHAIFAIPAVKAIEFGTGFKSASLRGSQMNDPLINAEAKTATNNSGGINGGITNGNPITFRVAFRPAPSIGLPQETWNFATGQVETLAITGRHDTCLAIRAAVIVEAATAIVLADLKLIHKATKGD